MPIAPNTEHHPTNCQGCSESSCSGHVACEAEPTAPSEGGLLKGGLLVGASAGFFLGPVVLAILGAMALDGSSAHGTGQFLGAIVGLTLGFGASWILARICLADLWETPTSADSSVEPKQRAC